MSALSASSSSSFTGLGSMPRSSTVRSSSSATGTHPALLSLHAAVEAADRLTEPLERSLSAPLQPPAAPHALFLDAQLQREWGNVYKHLTLLVDLTHPDGAAGGAGAGGTSAPSGCRAEAVEDGRAVLLGLRHSSTCSSSSSFRASPPDVASRHDATDDAIPVSVDELTRLYTFLRRVAELVWRLTAAAHTPSSASVPSARDAVPDAAGASSAASSSSHSPSMSLVKTKALLQVEDVVEPLLIHGCAVASNLASFASRVTASKEGVSRSSCESRAALGNALFDCVLAVTRLYQHEKRLLHLLLSVLSNVVTWPGLRLSPDRCAFLYQLITPFYTSHSMVAAWTAMLCNLTAVYASSSVPTLLRLGAVADIERLCLAVSPLESITAERVVRHSLQVVSNIAVYAFDQNAE